MTHEPDASLIKKARGVLARRASNGPSTDDRDKLTRLLNDYTVACHLSRGPDGERCDHWTTRAQERRARLKTFLDGSFEDAA